MDFFKGKIYFTTKKNFWANCCVYYLLPHQLPSEESIYSPNVHRRILIYIHQDFFICITSLFFSFHFETVFLLLQMTFLDRQVEIRAFV